MSSGSRYRDYRFQVEGGLSSDLVAVRFLIPDDTWLRRQMIALVTLLTQGYAWELGTGATVSVDDVLSSMSEALDSLMFVKEIGRVDMFVIAEDLDLPEPYLECIGASYSRDDYPELWAVLPDHLKDDTSFVTPVMTGASPIGNGADFKDTFFEVGKNYGQQELELSVDNLPPHTHSEIQASLSAVTDGAGVPVPVSGAPYSGTTGSTGGGVSVNIVHPVIAVRYGIVAK